MNLPAERLSESNNPHKKAPEQNPGAFYKAAFLFQFLD
jgi:hypothetical protein